MCSSNRLLSSIFLIYYRSKIIYHEWAFIISMPHQCIAHQTDEILDRQKKCWGHWLVMRDTQYAQYFLLRAEKNRTSSTAQQGSRSCFSGNKQWKGQQWKHGSGSTKERARDRARQFRWPQQRIDGKGSTITIFYLIKQYDGGICSSMTQSFIIHKLIKILKYNE